MFCLHKRKVKVSERITGLTTIPDSNYCFTKITRVYFCPDCNRNVIGKYLK